MLLILFNSALASFLHRLYDELTGVNDEIGDLEDRLAALKDKADSLGKKYISAKKESEKADKEVQVNSVSCAVHWTLLSNSLHDRVQLHLFNPVAFIWFRYHMG